MSFLLPSRGRTVDVAALPYDPRSPEGLAARWVQWVAAAPWHKNPVDDRTGEVAAANQPDDVWFLAGSYGETLRRRCTVPPGRELFVPVFSMWHPGADGPPPVVDRAFGSLVVDGVAHDPEVIGTPFPFPVTGGFFNGVTGRRRAVPVTVWGLWSLVPALGPGGHELRVVGGDGYGFSVDVTYELGIGEPALSWP